MNAYLFICSMIVGLFGSIMEVLEAKGTRRIIPIYIMLFFLAVVSSINGNMSETDLGSYLIFFENHNNAYFSIGYRWFTDILHFLIGNNRLGFVASIGLIQIIMAWICASQVDNTKNHFLTFYILYNSYWGISFSIEIIRTGLGVAFSLLAVIMASKRKIIPTVILMLFSTLFHITEALMIPYVLLLLFRDGSNRVIPSKYIIWGGCLVLLDGIGFGYKFFDLIRTPTINVLNFLGADAHYMLYVGRTAADQTGYMSRQYIFYFLLGFSLVYLQTHSNGDRRLLDGYFIGLSIRTFFIAFGAVTRLQWVFLVLSVLVIYNYILEQDNSKLNKMSYLSILSIAQSLMAMLYLDIRF